MGGDWEERAEEEKSPSTTCPVVALTLKTRVHSRL